MTDREAIDGNEAAARVAFRCSEVIAIYPITPASPMAEHCDAWAAAGRTNLWETVPEVIEMQSEAGAAGTLHGAATRGALATTFTASQGLLLMLPNMFKIAGELTPAVIHVAARSVATHALSIFGDHSDVMAARTTGWAMLASGSVQEAADFALVAHAATLESRVPFLHFFDGFRTSHEIATIQPPTDADIAALVDDDWIAAHRLRALDPDRPVLRGTAQNPDVFFQAREALNPFVDAVPTIVEGALARLGERTGRRYGLVEYVGAPDAERVVILMGSAIGAAREAVEALLADGEKVGVLQVRLYRPFPGAAIVAALPETVRAVAVLDRTKEPGAPGEPLRLDVVASLAEAASRAIRPMPRVVGGRYGLSSKEFTPAMVRAVLASLGSEEPRDGFTVGIVDDVTHTSLPVDPSFTTDRAATRAVFFGLGSDGTVGANKQTVKIVGQHTDGHAQGYFVYDSKKSGSMTVSHLRFDPAPIRSTYLVHDADFVACHQFGLLDRVDVLERAAPGATFLINSPYPPDSTWDHLPREVQEAILEKDLDVHVIDAHRVARDSGLAGQINIVMQVCCFALTDLLPLDVALEAVRASVRSAYGKRGGPVVDANLAAIDAAQGALARLPVPPSVTTDRRRRLPVGTDASEFVQRVTARILAGEGDLLPVSALPVDGTFPTGTARVEKRTLATEIPIWDPEICIDCARCALVCPHAAIRMKIHDPESTVAADADLPSKPFRSHDHPGLSLTIQVAPDDCTGCGVCVDVCPAKSKSEVKHKAIDMEPIAPHLERERARFDAFLRLDGVPDGLLDPASVKGAQAREPLFEFSGACAGCGETPYLKLLSQLFGDRALIANATGCSSIYGGNLPTTPWGTDAAGRGPAWSNSLFEDNAEFGLGMRIALDRQSATARRLVSELASHLGEDLTAALLAIDPTVPIDDAAVAAQRALVEELDVRLARLEGDGDEAVARRARTLMPLTGTLVRKNVWIVGGDGWAYDIGAGGLDHVLGSGRDVNVLVLDTEVYSNTGGQASKSTPRAAVAKFASAGKRNAKKDLGVEARRYGDVYIAQVAIGANDIQTVKAFSEAEAWPGPSLIIAYSTCIAHGIDMRTSMTHQRDAVRSGYWPLYRFHPGADEHTHPFHLDSKAPSIPLSTFLDAEGRYAMLGRTNPDDAETLRAAAQADVDERWRYYTQLAGIERTLPEPLPTDGAP
ncbi:MAG TPA: pyruvate:ferredoxin (flavodoxin) oxidoreductase [Acidimicrobiia bacterium]|nr:pyruvate:ferredoxin (flavodoxin) oxidoreductase [Acidimicrobiia bacterium]